jgi:hypothetical protein
VLIPKLLSDILERQVIMTESSSTARQPGLVTITGLGKLSSFLSELQSRPHMASQIKALEYNKDEVTDARQDALMAANATQYNADLTYVLEQITQRGQLDSFRWNVYYDDGDEVELRPEAFWTALAGAAGTLKHLSFQFAPHELYDLWDLVRSVTL